jgi:ParB family chromosome partitioning protein
MSEQIRQVPLSKLVESPDNPRKLFGNLTEFAKTLKGGVLQPLVAREVAGDKLELVIGHRRFRGAKLAGLKELPVIVREYTREQALEAMVIENVHREDVNPLELADSFAQMKKDFGLSGDDISDRVKMPRTKVHDLLSLNEHLIEASRKTVLNGKIGMQSAVWLARVRGERLQTAALEDVMKLAKKEGDLPPLRAVKKLIQAKYMGSDSATSKRQKAARERVRAAGAEVAFRRRVLQRLLTRVGELVERKHHLDETDMRTMAIATAEAAPNQEATQEVLARRGIKTTALGKVGATQLRSLVVELALAPYVQLDADGAYSSGTKVVAKAYGLSLSEIEKALEATENAEALFKKE